MSPEQLLIAPPVTHFVYIPFLLFVGAIIGFVVGRKAGVSDGQAEYLAGLGDDDDLLGD